MLTKIILQLFLLTLTDTVNAQEKSAALTYGKYACTASKYMNGSYEFIPRGAFSITRDGKYAYSGFKTPSNGKFAIDTTGSLLFKGGYLDGGKATRTDRPNKFFLVFPSNPDNRWTCSCNP